MREVGFALAHHVPDDGEVCAEDTTEGLEDRICAEWNVVPGEVGTTMTKYNCKT